MEVGYVADVYTTEGDARTGGDGSIEETLHYFNGGCVVRAEGWAEDPDRVYDGEFEAVALACNKVPGRALSDGLRLGVSGKARTIEIGPVALIEGSHARLLTVADGDEGGGENYSLNACLACRVEDAEGAIARGNDELLFVLWRFGWERGGHMEDEAAAGYGFGPSGVSGEIGCDEGESILAGGAGNVQHAPNIGLTLQGTDGSPYAVACAEKLVDAMGAHKSRAAGDEYEFFTHEYSIHDRPNVHSVLFCPDLLP
jgi:hypothetical protein